MTTPALTVTDHDDFERQLIELRKREKTHREGDAIARAQHRRPMTKVPPDTTVIGADGPVPFGDVASTTTSTSAPASRHCATRAC